jgi:hypothetical protein
MNGATATSDSSLGSRNSSSAPRLPILETAAQTIGRPRSLSPPILMASLHIIIANGTRNRASNFLALPLLHSHRWADGCLRLRHVTHLWVTLCPMVNLESGTRRD